LRWTSPTGQRDLTLKPAKTEKNIEKITKEDKKIRRF
jgi:hypothetical protein